MKRMLITMLILPLLGAGCLKEGKVVPLGYAEYSEEKLTFQYPEEMTINKYSLNDEEFDFTSNILVTETTSEEIENYCWETYGYRYADNPSLKPTLEKLTTLANEGYTYKTRSEFTMFDPGNCGWGWDSYDKFSITKGEYNGIIDYGCAGNSGQCTPDFNWINVTLVNNEGHVYLISFRPIFGNLKDRDLLMFVDTEKEWDAVASATRDALTTGTNFYESMPAIDWFDDLKANVKTMEAVIENIEIIQ